MPDDKPVMVVLVPVPVIPPGLMIQVPIAGNPDKVTVPVNGTQVAFVIALMVGAIGLLSIVIVIGVVYTELQDIPFSVEIVFL